MASDLIRFSVAMPEDLLETFDEYVARRGVNANRSEVIRDLVRDALVDELWDKPGVEVAGTITMMYDHHTSDLTHKLDEVQHDFCNEVISTMHVHLDHHNCLEVVALKGDAQKIRMISDRLLGIKGVKEGRLTITSTGRYL